MYVESALLKDMIISQYVAGWDLIKNSFDIKDYLDNAFYYVDEVCVALNTSKDNSLEILNKYKQDTGRNLKIIETNFSYDDPFCYGKIVNAALQGCSGDILALRDLDERNGGSLSGFQCYCNNLLEDEDYQAYFLPVINLYGDYDHYDSLNGKWYLHKRGLFRGAVNFGIKSDGRPDYNRTSTDELIDKDGNLVSTYQTFSKDGALPYMKNGWPFVYHLGYCDFNARVKRNVEMWIPFWEKATGGDKNNHATDIKQLENKETFEHGLRLWHPIQDSIDEYKRNYQEEPKYEN